jgi:two-component system, LytTR family, response regulator
MLNCLIIDDEIAAIEVLEYFIKKTPQLNLIASTDNPIEGLSIVQREAIDLVFLDVQMPELSGIDFIKAINGKCKVILTTAYREYALEGYELDVIDYLMKPIPFSRFLKAVQKATEMIPAKNTITKPADQYDFILVKTETKGKFLKIDTADIDYIEGMDNYVAIFCRGKKTVAFINMKDLEEKLPKDKFMRVHKSFIVAIDKIVSIEGNSLLLKNNVQAGILIGNAYRTAFLEKMKSRLID